MANDLNQCNFIGRLGKDPETRYLPSGGAVTSFSIACGWKSKDKEGTEWVNVVCFDKLAEIVGEYCRKGGQVFVSGRFKNEKYKDKDGIERYSVKIVADRVQLLGSRQDGPAKESEPGQGDGVTVTAGGDFEDDIPFS